MVHSCKIGAPCYVGGMCYSRRECDQKFMTRADRLRNVSDEALARSRVIYGFVKGKEVYAGDFGVIEITRVDGNIPPKAFSEALAAEIDWLQQPTEEEKT